jgi:hypothetical protein
MPATKRGIFHNLRESKYVVSNGEITFYFSSEFYLMKFLEEYQDNRLKFKKKMNQLLENNPFNMDSAADIQLYERIEKRGFFAKILRAKMTKENLYHYALRKMTEHHSGEWVRVSA